jgi:hypothetical protein
VQLPVFPDEGCVDKLRLMEGGLPGLFFGVEWGERVEKQHVIGRTSRILNQAVPPKRRIEPWPAGRAMFRDSSL